MEGMGSVGCKTGCRKGSPECGFLAAAVAAEILL